MSSFERLNSYPVNVPSIINVKQDGAYELRSVVAVTETEISQGEKSTNIITGCTGLIMKHRDFNKNIYNPTFYLYDPFGASLPVRHPGYQNEYITNKPISYINEYYPMEGPDGLETPGFFQRASRTGTIFVYAKPGGYNPTDTISV